MSEFAKSQSLMMKLKSQLEKRLSSYTFLEQMDASGNPVLRVSADATPAAGEQVFCVRIKMQDTQFDNSIGLDQRVYTPCVCQIIQETGILTLANQVVLDNEVSRMGVTQERYRNTAGTVPALTQFAADGSVTGSNFEIRISSDLKWPLSGQ